MTILEAVKKAGEDGEIRRGRFAWFRFDRGRFDFDDFMATDWEAKPKKRWWKLHVYKANEGFIHDSANCQSRDSDMYETVSVVEED